VFNKHDKQMYAMDKALHELNLDAHIYQVPYKKDLSTYADKLIGIQFERLIPIHRSFMYCNSLDMDFFFSKDNIAMYSYSGRCFTKEEGEKLIKAFEKANKVIDLMNKYIKE